MKHAIFLLLITCSLSFAYENLTPAQVHQRLAAGDSLLLLDVREVYEYRDGHIAEPTGQPVLTPANMPLSSGVLNANFDLLPRDMDIVVYCRSGGRSASASAFLEGQGFSRLFNMTGGFSGWTYESRTGGYGDGSGAWISDTEKTISCASNPDLAQLSLAAASGADSLYVEWHSLAKGSPFSDLPDSSRLFLLTALDKFGLTRFEQDSLLLTRNVTYTFSVNPDRYVCQTFSPGTGWKPIKTQYADGKIVHQSQTLYKWMLLAPKQDTKIEMPVMTESPAFSVYPNPFNGQLKLQIPADARTTVYNLLGRPIAQFYGTTWNPAPSIGSGVYLIRVHWRGQSWQRKVLYQK